MQDVDPAARAGFVQGRVPRVVVVVHVTALLLQAVQHHVLHNKSTAVTSSPGGAAGAHAGGHRTHLVAQASCSLQERLPRVLVHNQPPSSGRNVLGRGRLRGTPRAGPMGLTKCPQVLGLLRRARFGLVAAAFPLGKKGIQLLGTCGHDSQESPSPSSPLISSPHPSKPYLPLITDPCQVFGFTFAFS